MGYNLYEFLNSKGTMASLEGFYRLTGLSSMIVDLKGQVLVKIGTNKLCDFYKNNLTANLQCKLNMMYISKELLGGKDYIIHECSKGRRTRKRLCCCS